MKKADEKMVSEKIYFDKDFKSITEVNHGKNTYIDCVFRKVDFSDLKMNGMVFFNCTFSDCNFAYSSIGDINNPDSLEMFSLCGFFDCLFGDADITLIAFNTCVFSDVSFVDSVLKGVLFNNSIFHDSNFCAYIGDDKEIDYEAELESVIFIKCPNIDYYTAQTIIDTKSEDVWYENESFAGHSVVFSIIENKIEL